jgi:hypothetical protein
MRDSFRAELLFEGYGDRLAETGASWFGACIFTILGGSPELGPALSVDLAASFCYDQVRVDIRAMLDESTPADQPEDVPILNESYIRRIAGDSRRSAVIVHEPPGVPQTS